MDRLREWRVRLRIPTLCKTAAKAAEATMRDRARRGVNEPFYLCIKRGGEGHDGAIRMVPQSEEIPPEFELFSAEPLRGNAPYSAFCQWITERVRSAPLLGH